jgi:hypothetical protein
LKNRIIIAKPPAFDATERNAVIVIGSPFVDVGGPEVEGDRGDLVAEPGQGKDAGNEEREGSGAPAGEHLRQGAVDRREVERPAEAVQERDPVEHEPGGDRAVDQIFERGFARVGRLPGVPGEEVGAERGELDGDVHHQQIVRPRHQHHPESGGAEERVILPELPSRAN